MHELLPNIKKIKFGKRFNEKIINNDFPIKLTLLRFGWYFTTKFNSSHIWR